LELEVEFFDKLITEFVNEFNLEYKSLEYKDMSVKCKTWYFEKAKLALEGTKI